MDAKERRVKIVEMLKLTEEPIPAAKIAENLSVSRQIIVGDIALIRAHGIEILATPRGYLINGNQNDNNMFKRKIACRHDMNGLKKELYTIVDNGCTVIDVIVDHPYYGELTGALHIQSRYDADEFIRKVDTQIVKPLSLLTNGVHVHTISSIDKLSLERTIKILNEEGILL